MKVKWLGHSCFKVSENDESIILDPFADGSVPGLKSIREEASQVYCSHEHGDHNARENVKVKGYDPFKFEVIDTFHDDQQGKLRGPNKIYIFTIGKQRLAHFGDLGCDLTKMQIEKLKGIDVILIPVGGFYTIDSTKAKEIIDLIQPRVIIPMHYQGDSFGYNVLDHVDFFLEKFMDYTVVDNNTIEIDKNTKGVIVLKYL